MDRKGNKKIVQYICGCLAALIVLTVGFILFTAYAEMSDRYWTVQLLQNHPELEAELIEVYQKKPPVSFFDRDANKKIDEQIVMLKEKYGYTPCESAFLTSMLSLYLLVIGCFVVVAIAFIWAEKRQERKLTLQNDVLLRNLAEELKKFQKGDFHSLSKRIAEAEEMEISEAAAKVWEVLSELGFYFGDLKEQLKQEENSTKALITDIAHQLKTPLASLRMSHELTQTENLTDEERKEFLVQEGQEIQNLEALIGELVQLSRLENQMIQIHPKQQNIRPAIAEAVSQVYGKAKGKQIGIEVEMERDYLVLHDRKWTVEALSNILDNAIKYSEAQTTVHVRVSRLNYNLLIEIEDEGMGIASKELHLIFKRFYRSSNAAAKVKDGVGVGLYLARNIFEQHGGTISAKSRLGEGTVFRITIPCQ